MLLRVLSDIHGNSVALAAVLADTPGRDADATVCLGDVVGYGPNPCECIDEVMQMDGCILGNHDQAALFDPEGFSSGAERAKPHACASMQVPMCSWLARPPLRAGRLVMPPISRRLRGDRDGRRAHSPA